MARHLLLGRDGEGRAARLLESLGLEVLERNWRCEEGELDLVARRGDLIVFCEVKTRRSRTWGEPFEAVHVRKQARIKRLAGRWLAEHRTSARSVRFDVVSIVAGDGDSEVVHLPDAF